MSDNGITNRENLLDILVSNLEQFVVVLVSREGNFTSWHPGVLAQFGYEREEFIGKSAELLLPPEDRGKGESMRELETAAERGHASDTRMLVTRKNEHILVEGVTIALRDGQEELAGYGKVLQNVTERKAAEEGLRAIARALDQTTVIVRQWNGVIEHWTAGCEYLYGWPAQEAVGRYAHELLRTKFPMSLQKIQAQLLSSGTWKGELEQVRRDGTQVFVSTYWVMLSEPDGEPVSVIETHSDITARLQVQKELEAANQRLKRMALELERSNQDLEEFARIASHDLSAPITSTRWLADLLVARHSTQLDDAGKRCLTQITQGLTRMSDLVDAVLAHARVGTSAIGSMDPSPAQAALDASIDNLHRHIVMTGAIVERGALPDVQVEPQALNQLFQNLVSNAIKYRREGVPPRVSVRAQWKTEMWLFSVSDNGIGIEHDWHERIFQPMQRRHGLEVAGSGIGLATCKKIVTRAGGHIWVESQPGEGATFFFTLPGPAPRGE